VGTGGRRKSHSNIVEATAQGFRGKEVRALLHGLVGGLAGAILVIAGQVYGDRASTWVTQNVFEPVVGSNDGPLELSVRNDSSRPYAMTELRAGNDARCYNDFLVTGSNYNDPGDGTLEANEASIVSESLCARMHIKANSGEIKFTTVAPGKTSANLHLKDGVVHLAIADCDRAAHVPNTAGYLCGDKEGILWWVPVVGSRRALSPHPIQNSLRVP
jgi:hypothetical protein